MSTTSQQFEAIATAASACAAKPNDDYARLTLMRAIIAADVLYTDELYEATADLARVMGEDIDGDLDEDAIAAAVERGYPGNRYMRDAIREMAA